MYIYIYVYIHTYQNTRSKAVSPPASPWNSRMATCNGPLMSIHGGSSLVQGQRLEKNGIG